MSDPLSRDDVADLVIGVAVERRLARLDDSHDLRHIEAARVLVDEISEAPLDRSLELWLVVEADRHLALAAGLRAVLGGEHGKDAQVLRAGVLDGIGLAWREIDTHVGFQIMRVPVDVEPALAVHDVQNLLLSGELPLRRPPGPEADHALLQPLAAVGGVESHADSRRVTVVLNGFEIVLVDHETADSRHRWILGRLVERDQLNDLDCIANCHAAGFGDLPVDAEGDVSLALLVLGEAAVGRDRLQRVEVRFTALGILGRDRTAADVPADPDQSLADPDVLLDPAVLLVRLAAVELEEHPEAATVDRRVSLALAAELGKRRGRDQRNVTPVAVDREPGRRVDEPKRAAGPTGER